MKNFYTTLALCLLLTTRLLASGEPSTYFNIFVPPNNDAVQRNVALIVTAIHDSTSFSIVDDNMDGDEDDQVQGILMAGQSYILYIKDNGINDDARYASGGTLKRDGDYFTISSNKLVYASMSTDSDWQHDFVPSVNKRSVGERFIIYSPKTSYSLRDLNVFAYEENTTITISKISQSATLQSGYTDVQMNKKTIISQRTLNPGEDIIHFYPDGRDIMQTGETYMIEANRGISVQYGALWKNARDGGGYVPAGNGSYSGELFYFAVPYQAVGEQEIRIVSWDDNNAVSLERYENGNWLPMDNWSLNRLAPADWVGKQNGNATYPTVFRVRCTAGKRVSVLEANWMETGAIGTSDMATTVSAANGTTSGKEFLVYMSPPGNEQNVVDPFSGSFFTGSQTHFYLFANNKDATVYVKDAKTNGQVINRMYTIKAGRYADAKFNVEEWKSIYNGTGTPSGDERPYVLIQSDENIAVLATNFNDNWMTYFGSSLPQSFTQLGNASNKLAAPGDTVILQSNLSLSGGATINDASVAVLVGSGALPVNSQLTNQGTPVQEGTIEYTENQSSITYDPLATINATDLYTVETTLVMSSAYNDGEPVAPETVVSVETTVSGMVDGQFQQSLLSQGIQNNSDDASKLLFSNCSPAAISEFVSDSWNGAWVDTDNDGWDDLMITDKSESNSNLLLRNASGSFSTVQLNGLTTHNDKTVAAIWADINNDGLQDAFVVNATGSSSKLFLNEGGNSFIELKNSGIDVQPQYAHGASWADFDNDGLVDLLITNFFPTRFHQLYRNRGDNTFESITNAALVQESARAMAPLLADYDRDGLIDVFIPNGNNQPNSLFRNLGNFRFEKVSSGAIATDKKNSVGGAWADYDQDGDLDLLVVNASGQDNDFYLNQGDGTFAKESTLLFTREGGHSHSASWLDLENDGDLDLLITNDQGPNFLYINDGAGNFSRKLDEQLAANFGHAYGAAWSDYDRDGDLDALIFTHNDESNYLFCNQQSGNNWLSLKLNGSQSNRNAIGAVVKLKANGKWQMQQLAPVSGFGSQSSMRLHFGLGKASTIDSLLIDWPSGYRQYIDASGWVNSQQTIQEDSGNELRGITFHDINGNGSRDADEPVVGNINLQLVNSSKRLRSTPEGTFSLRLANGSYQLQTAQVQHWQAYSSPEFSLGNGNESLAVDVPLQAIANGHDLKIHYTTTPWRRGFVNQSVLTVENTGTHTAQNCRLSLSYPGEVLLKEADTPMKRQENTYSWEISALAPGEQLSISLQDSVGLDAYIGQQLSLSGSISAEGTELDATDNSLNETITIVGAIDPNDILVSPAGQGTEGFIAPDQTLTYTIRFQNVGTFAATYVQLANLLPKELDFSTFELVAASHKHSYSLSANGELLVQFAHLNLPPEEQNEKESHGYFQYRIRPKQGLPGGTPIYNQASITFDFEAPVITNRVISTIQYEGTTMGRLLLYPNPASDQINIQLASDYHAYQQLPHITAYTLIDSRGLPVREAAKLHAQQLRIDLRTVPAGMYFLKLTDHFGNVYRQRLLKQ